MKRDRLVATIPGLQILRNFCLFCLATRVMLKRKATVEIQREATKSRKETV